MWDIIKHALKHNFEYLHLFPGVVRTLTNDLGKFMIYLEFTLWDYTW